MAQSLYERIGGERAIMSAVGLFYERVLADELTRPFFEKLDMVAQSRKQGAFLAWAFGGPEHYKGRELRTAHASLVKKGLSDAHFDAVVRHLKATLHQLDIEDCLIDEAMSIVGGARDIVLGR